MMLISIHLSYPLVTPPSPVQGSFLCHFLVVFISFHPGCPIPFCLRSPADSPFGLSTSFLNRGQTNPQYPPLTSPLLCLFSDWMGTSPLTSLTSFQWTGQCEKPQLSLSLCDLCGSFAHSYSPLLRVYLPKIHWLTPQHSLGDHLCNISTQSSEVTPSWPWASGHETLWVSILLEPRSPANAQCSLAEQLLQSPSMFPPAWDNLSSFAPLPSPFTLQHHQWSVLNPLPSSQTQSSPFISLFLSPHLTFIQFWWKFIDL